MRMEELFQVFEKREELEDMGLYWDRPHEHLQHRSIVTGLVDFSLNLAMYRSWSLKAFEVPPPDPLNF